MLRNNIVERDIEKNIIEKLQKCKKFKQLIF